MAQQRTPTVPEAEDTPGLTVQIVIRVDETQRAELARAAKAQHTDTSNLTRRLWDEHVRAVDAGIYPYILRPSDLEHPDQGQAAA